VHVVRFVYQHPSASHVAVVGDFNGWGQSEIPLQMNADGVWTATVALSSGSHEYAFVVDRGEWVADPAALSARDEFGTPTSRVQLGAVDYSATE
jgi:1,4-alpha-glucan branching enzyme